MESDIKINETGLGLITANYHLHSWSDWSEDKTEKILDELKVGLQKLAQHLDLDVIDEEGYLI